MTHSIINSKGVPYPERPISTVFKDGKYYTGEEYKKATHSKKRWYIKLLNFLMQNVTGS